MVSPETRIVEVAAMMIFKDVRRVFVTSGDTLVGVLLQKRYCQHGYSRLSQQSPVGKLHMSHHREKLVVKTGDYVLLAAAVLVTIPGLFYGISHATISPIIGAIIFGMAVFRSGVHALVGGRGG